jgi:hypothetical protein
MQQVTGAGVPSAKPDGIPVRELTYGTVVSMTEYLLPFVDDTGEIAIGSFGPSDRLRSHFELMSQVMPWGVFAASCIKLCNQMVGFIENTDRLRLDVWNEAKRLIIHNAVPIAGLSGMSEELLAESLQSFINDSVLVFLLGIDIKEVSSPTSLGCSEYEYAVLVTVISSALIFASANCKGSLHISVIEELKSNLNGIALSI